jgi:DNA polymerase-3 subunit delta'
LDLTNEHASNKLLKLLEPPEKTIFILLSENEEDIIQTIRSRCQVLNFNALEPIITQRLIDREAVDPKIAASSTRHYNTSQT